MRFICGVAVVLVLAALAGGCGKKGGERAAPVASATPSAETVAELPKPTFTKKGPRLHQKVEVAWKHKLTIVPDNPATAPLEIKESMLREEQVLEVSDGRTTKARVAYAELAYAQNDASKHGKKTKQDARAGKTYLLEVRDGKLVVTGEDGKATVPAEASLVEQDFRYLAKPLLADALPTHTLKHGEQLPEFAQAFQDTFVITGMTTSDARVSFREERGDEGIFDVAVTLRSTDLPVQLTILLTGHLRLRTDGGYLIGMKLTGPITVAPSADPKEKLKMSGTGRMELETTRTDKK